MQFVDVSDAAIGVLVVGFLVAAVVDWRTREVDDRIWLAVALLGGALQAVVLSPDGVVAVVVWVVVVAFVVQHLLPWDDTLVETHASLPGAIELSAYVGVGALLAVVGWR